MVFLDQTEIPDQFGGSISVDIPQKLHDESSGYIDKHLYQTITPSKSVFRSQKAQSAFNPSCGKSALFTESFNQNMFQDNSLMAASRQRQRLLFGHKQKQIKREKEIQKLESNQ